MLLSLLVFILLVILIPVLYVIWAVRSGDYYTKIGEEMAKVPTPPEHLNPPNRPRRGGIPVERLKGDYEVNDEDTFWELSYLTRNDSEAPFRRETRHHLCLDMAKDEAILLKDTLTFYREVRICQRLKTDMFYDA